MDATQRMELFGNLSLLFGIIALIGLALSIFFFFYFDIRSVYALMTGKAKRKTIERMNQNNNRTGRLPATSGSVRDPSVPVVQNPITERTDVKPGAAKPKHAAAVETVSLGQTPETSVLSAEPETSILGNGNETMVLSNQPAESGATMVLSAQDAPAPAVPPIRFDITETTMVINTNELI